MVRYEKGLQSEATYLYLDWKLEHDASEGKSEEVGDARKSGKGEWACYAFDDVQGEDGRLSETDEHSTGSEEGEQLYLAVVAWAELGTARFMREY